MNIFHNFVPNEIINCRYKQPPWMTDYIKSRLRERSKMTKKYYKYGQVKSYLDELQEKTDECTALILDAKEKYVRCMSNKLNDPSLTAPKTYWSILNRFPNNRKILAIPPLLVNGDVITSFSEKADLFNKFFADQCTPFNNLHKLPPFSLKTYKKLCNLIINKSDTSTIIRNLDPNKSHGWDNSSVRMIKLCGDSLIYPLKCIFEGALQENKYLDCWKKANVVPVHKKRK